MKIIWEARGWPLTLALLFVACSLTVDFCRGDDGACPNNTCANSSLCCSQYNFCGSNASYCGSGCLGGPCYSNSPSISPTTSTPIGSCGPNNPCGGGNCCSQYGYCGSAPDYCGCGCTGGPCYSNSTSSSCSSGGKSLSTGAIAGIAIGAVVGAILLLGACLFVARRRTRKKGNVLVQDLEAKSFEKGSYDPYGSQLGRTATFASTLSSQRKRLSSETLHSATNGFSYELGRGAFGIVYKGTLEDGQEIAVKKMLDGQRDAKDFEAEVKTLGSINHANLVALHGFTLERNALYLIYEFVANGSLDQWIFEKQKADKEFVLPWQTRVDILKGTARGLSYLHGELQGGKAIVHLDIKPQNILLDESYVPKIADFGLAKLLGSETTRQTLASGGTMGYMAPEVYLGAASPKMDVYSFGMVLLEVVCGREHVFESSSTDSLFLPAWAIRKIKIKEQLDVVDPLLQDQYDTNLATRLIWIALVCLQRDQDERPDMSDVLKMMEGILIPQDLPPTLQSEFEMAEKLIRKRVTTDASLNFIEFSGSSRKHKNGEHQLEAEESEKRHASNSGADNDFKLS